ncbi:MAG TPA: hypothetical protein VK194_01330, partial [Candidatus Deferrimicrobium sp.]|nr:hypothetical protein [Candidatus Deferrimicrobium sp.]
MPDGAATTRIGDPADERALAADGRLIRGVRWRLVLWSGLTTLVVLAVLGAALYLSAARTLEERGVAQLSARTNQIVDVLENPGSRPSGPEYGFIFGGNSSGTFAMALDARGNNLGRGPIALPDGLPVMPSLAAAVQAGTDVRVATVGSLPIRAMTERITLDVGDVYIQVI